MILSVADSGTGIPAADLERIFHRFARANPRRTREAGGFGLGLAVVQAIAEAHHGSARASSTLGQGSVFEVLLPAGPGAGGDARSARAGNGPDVPAGRGFRHLTWQACQQPSGPGFYKTALKGRGWRILYAGRNAGSTDIVAMLGTTGVGISISHADPAGTAILVLACDC